MQYKKKTPTAQHPENWEPSSFMVYCIVHPTKVNDLDRAYMHRVGVAKTLREVKSVIEDDMKAMINTLGGLIAQNETSCREYRAFEAKWSELDVNRIMKE